MGAHAESVRNRFKMLLLFMDAVAGAPPPCLMNKWSVRGVHQPNDAMVNTDGHCGLQVCEVVLTGKLLKFRRWIGSFDGRSESSTERRRIWNVHPDKIVLLFAGVATRINPIDFQFLIGRERRN